MQGGSNAKSAQALSPSCSWSFSRRAHQTRSGNKNTIAIKENWENAVDPGGTPEYRPPCESRVEHPTAGKRAAAERRGGWVLIHQRDFRSPTAGKAVGFF